MAKSSHSSDRDFDDDDEPRPARKKKRKVIEDFEDDDESESDRRQRYESDDESDDRPRKKKKKKKRKEPVVRDEFSHLEEEPASHTYWWVLPTILILVGLILCIMGSCGYASVRQESSRPLSTVFVLVMAFIQFIVAIPIIATSLIIGGSMFGIEYGTPVQAIINIAAICAFTLGLDWMLLWSGLWFAPRTLISVIVCFTLLMLLFDLDAWEAAMSMVCIRVMMMVSFFTLNVFLLNK